MSTVFDRFPAQKAPSSAWLNWLPVAAGLLAMYVPSYLDLSKVFWKTEIGGHGPIILAVVIWLFWRAREVLVATDDTPMPKLGWGLVAFAVLLYAVGRSQSLFQFEVGSQIPLLAGLVLALKGHRAAKALWFPIFFVVFLVPIPGSMLDAILLPLKRQVSVIVETLLFQAGYPVARSGVVLTIGPYQLLIADACSGLNSMIALSGVGLLFVYLMQSRNWIYNGILLASILPTAFIANIARVLLLMLVTFYGGDDAGQAFHDYAGYLEIVFAFGAFFALDAILRRFVEKHDAPAPSASSPTAA